MWFRRSDEERSVKNDKALEATKALNSAQEHLEKVKERGEEVSKIVDAVKEIRERNHFAEAMEAILARPRRP